jgi:hypothetical protein
VRSLIITLAETYIVHRPLNAPHWHERIASLASIGLFVFVIILYILAVPKKLSNGTIKRQIVIACSAVMLFNLLRYLNIPVASGGLDPSWVWALNAITNNNAYLFGRDVAFTYGPLGYLFASAHYGINILQAIGINIFCIGMLSALFYANYKKGKFQGQHTFVFFLLVWPFAGILSFEWTWNLMLFLLCSTCWILRNEKRMYIPLVFITGIICAVSLMLKFNTAVLAIALAGILGLVFLIYDVKKLNFYIPLFFGSFLGLTVLNIVHFFKSFANFMLWLRMSWEVSGGFSYAMVTEGDLSYLIIAFVVTLLYIYLAVHLKKAKSDSLALALLGAVIIFFSFKHGFVRQDAHMLSFFSVMPFVTGFLFLFTLEDNYTKGVSVFKGSILLCLLCVMSISGLDTTVMSFFNNIYHVATLKENIQTFQERKGRAMKADILPDEWNNAIAGKSIQILPWELSYAGANHWDGWQPNPGLQLYSVYTKTLDEYSASSFEPAKAPAFILLEHKAIDGRNMFLDTPATWNSIIPNYRIVKNDGQRLLLEKKLLDKKSAHTSIRFIPLDTGSYTFNESIPIPKAEGPVYAKISIENTIVGKIITTLFRGNPAHLTLINQDGSENSYRIIADTLRNPVLVNCGPHNFEQTAALFTNEPSGEFAESKNRPSHIEGKAEPACGGIKFSAQVWFLYYKRNIKIEWFIGSDG